MKRLLLLIALFLSVCLCTYAQDFEVPQNYILKEKGDYAKYQADVLKAIDWLQKTSWAGQAEKRKQVNGFLIEWMTGSPTVSIEIGSGVTKLADKNNNLLIVYMAGYTKYVLENASDSDKNRPKIAGVKAVLEKYKSDSSLKKDKALDKLVQLEKDGKLEDWVLASFS